MKIKTGTYTGDASGGRAIPHGLGIAPKLVFICTTNTDAMLWRQLAGIDKLFSVSDSATGKIAVTTMDSTNFYLGSDHPGANYTAFVYYWVAIG